MHRRNRLFVAIGLLYGLAGGLVALAHLAFPGALPGDPAKVHAHLMLAGFVLMTIYGIGLHVMPRFAGRPLRSERAADVQFWLANAGLPLMVAGWLAPAQWLAAAGGALAAAAMALFAGNMLLTLRLKGPLD